MKHKIHLISVGIKASIIAAVVLFLPSKIFATEGIMVFYSSAPNVASVAPAYSTSPATGFSGTETKLYAVTIATQPHHYYVLRNSPYQNKREALLGFIDNTGRIYTQFWNGTQWQLTGGVHQIGGAFTTTNRHFDIAYYENDATNNRAIIVYGRVTGPSTTPLEYRIWFSTSSSWGGAVSVGTFPSGTARWVRLETQPGTNNVIMLASIDVGTNIAELWAGYWNGTTWTLTRLETTVNLRKQESGDELIFDLAFEQSRKDAMAVWVDTNTLTLAYSTWNVTNGWGTKQLMTFNVCTVAGRQRWVKLASKPNSNELTVAVSAATDDDLSAVIWNGFSWANGALIEETLPRASIRNFDVAYERNSGDALIVYMDGAQPPKYRTRPSGGTTWSTEMGASSVVSEAYWIKLIPFPLPSSDDIYMICNNADATSDVVWQKWNGSSWGPAYTVETESRNTSESFGIVFLPPDTIPPGKITSFVAETGTIGGEIKLSWVCPGNDGYVGNLPSGSTFYIQYASWTGVAFSTTTQPPAGGYHVWIPTSAIQGTTQGRTITSLSEGVTYYFRIWARDNYGNWSTMSDGATTWAQVTPPPAAPAWRGDLVEISTGHIKWVLEDTATNEEAIYISSATNTGARLSESLGSLTGTNLTTSWIEVSLSSNTLYTRYGEAWNAAGGSSWSSGLTVCTLAYPPDNVDVQPVSSDKIDISWNYSGATKYLIARSTADFTVPWSTATTILSPGTTHQDIGLTGNTTYWYRIYAYNQDNVLNTNFYSSPVSTITYPSPPTNFTKLTVSTTSITWQWTPPAGGADGYRIYRATDNTLITPMGIGTTTFEETGLSTNTAYGRFVRAYNIMGESLDSNHATFYTLAAAPTNLQVTAVYQSSVTLTWEAGGNPSGTRFGLARAEDENFTVNHTTFVWLDSNLTATTTDVVGLGGNTTYYFRVWAYNGNGVISGYSNVVSTTTLAAPPSAPTGLYGVALSTVSIKWEWNITSGATYYQVYSSPTVSLLANIEGSGTTTWIEVNLSSNTQYSRYVRAGNEQGLSGPSDTASRYTLAYPPTVLTATAVSSSTINLEWNNSGALKYELKRSSNNFVSSVVSTTTFNTTFSDSNLTAGVTYWFRVYAVNHDTITTTAIYSPTVSTRTLPAQVVWLSSSAATTTSITWTWPAALGADGYRIYRATDNTLLADQGSATTYTETGLSTNTAYGRFVRAYNTSGLGDASPSATFYTLANPPVSPSFTGVHYTSITFMWESNENPFPATKYGIAFSSDNFTNFVSTIVIFANVQIQTNYLHTGLMISTTYTYRIWAYNGDGIATDYVVTAGTRTKADDLGPDAVTNLAASVHNATVGSVRLTWTIPRDEPLGGGATTYQIRYATFSLTGGNFDTVTADKKMLYRVAVGAPGSTLTYTITGLPSNQTVYFAIKSSDVYGNISAMDTTTPQASILVPPHIVISEVQPYNAYTDYVELYNPNPFTVSLGGMYLDVYAGDVTFLSTHTIAPYSYFLISSATFSGITPDAISSAFAVTESGVTSYAKLRWGSGGPIIDAINWAASPFDEELPKLGTLSAGQSWQRKSAPVHNEAYGNGYDTNSNTNDFFASTSRTPKTRFASPLPDIFRPSAISNLVAVSGADDGHVLLSWSAPQDNDGFGTITTSHTLTGSYVIKYSSVQIIRENNFDSPTFAHGTIVISTSGVTPGTLSTYHLINLSPGTSYWFAIKSTDTAGNVSVWKSSADVASVNTAAYGWAPDLPPVSVSLFSTDMSSHQIKVVWGQSNVIDFNSYELQSSSWSDTEGFGVVYTSNIVTSTTFYHSGLILNNTYWYRIRVKDNTGNYSDFSSTSSAYPSLKLPEAPTLYIISLTTSQIKWVILDNSTREEKIYLSSNTVDILWESELLPLAGLTTSYLETGFTPNMLVERYAGAYNQLGSSWSAKVSTYTLSNPPVELVISTVTAQTVTISWQSNNNPAYTRWSILRSTDNFTTSTTTVKGFADNFTSTIFTDLELVPNTTYSYKVCSINEYGWHSAFTPVVTTRTYQTRVVLSEVMANPTAPEENREYVELYNLDDFEVDISSWLLTDSRVRVDRITDYTGPNDWGKAGTKIPPRGFAIVVNDAYDGAYNTYLSQNATSSLVIMVKVVDGKIGDSLTNASDSIIIDNFAGYCSTFTWTSDTGDGISWEKIDVLGDDSPSNWRVGIYGGTPGRLPDWIPPASVTNLSSVSSIEGAILHWTAPGNNGLEGILNYGSRYYIQYSTFANVVWSTGAARNIIIISTSNVSPGSTQSYTVTGLSKNTTYYFRIWTADESHNISGLSNITTTYVTHLAIYFIRFGDSQGDGMYIEFPSGKNALIDGGPYYYNSMGNPVIAMLEGKGVKYSGIDYVVLTHPHADHYSGLGPVADRYTVRNFYDTRVNNTDATGDETVRNKYASEPGCTRHYPSAGDILNWDTGGISVKVLNAHPSVLNTSNDSEINNTSIVLKLQYGSIGILLTGDIEKETESALVASYSADLPSHIMKVPHHGSISSSGENFLDAVYNSIPSNNRRAFFLINDGKTVNSTIVSRYDARNVLKYYVNNTSGTCEVAVAPSGDIRVVTHYPIPDPPTGSTAEPGDVVINEFLPNPAGEDNGNEWIELMNKKDYPINVLNWKVEITSGPANWNKVRYTITINSNIEIPPLGYLLMAQSNAYTVYDADFKYSDTSTMYSKGGGLRIKDSGGTVIDTVGYGGSTYDGVAESSACSTVTEGQSFTRFPEGNDTNNNLNDFVKTTILTPTNRFRYDPPSTVLSLTANTGTTEGEIILSWPAVSDDTTRVKTFSGIYVIKYSSVQIIKSADFDMPTFLHGSVIISTSGVTPGSLVAHTLTLIPGTSYWFAIKSTDTYGNVSEWISSADIPDYNTAAYGWAYDAPPPTPQNLIATPYNQKILLNWDSVLASDLYYYEIIYSSDNWTTQSIATNTKTNFYIHYGLTNDVTYYYKVRAVDLPPTVLFSAFSDGATTYPRVAPPIAPTLDFDLTATTTVQVKWILTDNADDEEWLYISSAADTGARLWASVGLADSGGTTTWIETGLTPNKSVTRYGEATNLQGSNWSAPLTVYTRANPPTNLTVTGVTHNSVSLSWSANNNPPGTRYEVSQSTDNFVLNLSTPITLAHNHTATNATIGGLISNTTYYFRVRAFNGNNYPTTFSDIVSTKTFVPHGQNPLDVVINEIAWMGTDASGEDEWVEFYNNTGVDIDLTGWRFTDNTSTITLSGKIPANGYFILADTTSVFSDITPNQTSSKLWLTDGPTGEKLRLVNIIGGKWVTIDEVDCSASAWFAGSKTVPKRTMERVSSTVSGNIAANWANNNKRHFNGLDRNNGIIYGTPGRLNSVSYPPDTTPPGPVTNLVATKGANPGEINLTWTAPGDNGYLGDNLPGASYILKYATYPLVVATSWTWYNSAIMYYQTWPVGSVGSTENRTVNLSPGVTYYFVLRTKDASGNISEFDTRSVEGLQATASAKEGDIGSVIRINEVAPDRTAAQGYDWIEFYNPGPSSQNIYYWQIYEAYTSTVTAFETIEANWNFPPNTYLVLRMGTTRQMSTPILKQPGGYYELYTSKTGIHDTDNVIYLTDSTGRWIDVVCYADRSGSLSGTTKFRSAYNFAVSTGQWHGPAATGANDVEIEKYCARTVYMTSSRSVARNNLSTDGTNPAYKEWWLSASLTMGAVNPVPDTTPPAQIATLILTEGVNRGTIRLTWTAVGDDDFTGTAAGYIVRYSQTPILNDTDFENAVNLNQASKEASSDTDRWAPKSPDQLESYLVGGLTPSVTYYFAIKAEDETLNTSLISNVPFCPASESIGSNVRINEVTTLTNPDWIEFYCSSAVNINGWKVQQIRSGADTFTTEKTLPNITLQKGDYLVLWGTTGTDETDTSGRGTNTFWDTYTSLDLRGPEGVIVLLDSENNIVDFVAYSQGSAPSWNTIWDNAAYYSQWSFVDYSTSSAVNWSSGDATKSFGRDAWSTDTDDTLLLARDDWKMFISPTPGAQNDDVPPSAITNLSALAGTAEGTINLTWSAPGDDGIIGYNDKGYYIVKYATYSVSVDISSWTWWNSISTTVASNVNRGWLIKSPPLNVGLRETATISNLYPGTTYYFAVRTVDDRNNWSELDILIGTNDPSQQAQAVATNLPPSAPTGVVAVSSNMSVNLSWSVNTELDLKFYRISSNTVNDFSSASEVATVSSATLSLYILNLKNGVTYYFWLQAIDEFGKVSEQSVVVSTMPIIRPPSGLNTVHRGSFVDLTWTPSPDAGASNFAGYIIYRSSDSATTGFIQLAVLTGGTTHQDNFNIEPTKTYYYFIRSSDTAGPLSNPTAVSVAVADDKSPDISVQIPSVEPLIVEIKGNSVVFEVDVKEPQTPYISGVDTSTVKINFVVSGTTTTVAFDEIINVVPVDGTTRVFSACFKKAIDAQSQTVGSILTNGGTFYYYITAKDGVGNSTQTQPRKIIIKVEPKASSIISAINGGTIVLLDGNPHDGETTVNIPAGALDTNTTITIAQKDADKTADNVPRATNEPTILLDKNDRKPIAVYEFGPKGTRFKKPVTITLLYLQTPDGKVRRIDGSEIPDVSEDTFKIYWHDGYEWRYIGGTVDKTKNTVTAKVNHFTLFAIFASKGAPEKPEAAEKFITPASKGTNDALTFVGQAQDYKEIVIYDINGRIIRKLEGTTSWDGTDEKGEIVEIGAYIWKATYTNGKTNYGTVVVAK